MDLPTEVALRGAATQALVSGMSCVDAQLKVDREPIREMAAAAVKCKRADARAKAKVAQEGGPSPQSLAIGVTEDGVTPLTPVAGEAAAGGPAQPEDPEARRPIPSPFQSGHNDFRVATCLRVDLCNCMHGLDVVSV